MNKFKDILSDVITWIGIILMIIVIMPIMILMLPYAAWRWAQDRQKNIELKAKQNREHRNN